MAEIIALDVYREQELLRIGYKRWHRRFDQTFNGKTGLGDLVPATLYQLAQPGGETTMDLYSLILGFMGYGAAVTFDDLEAGAQTRVLDIHLFLSDQIRFEIMYRLGWLDCFAGNRFSLMEMVQDFDKVKKSCSRRPPALSKNHTDYKAYCPLFELDQQIFLRRLFPEAVDAFKDAHHL